MAEAAEEEAASMPQEDPKPIPSKEETDVKESGEEKPDVSQPVQEVEGEQPAAAGPPVTFKAGDTDVSPSEVEKTDAKTDISPSEGEKTDNYPSEGEKTDMDPSIEGEGTDVAPSEVEESTDLQPSADHRSELQKVADEHKRLKRERAKLMLKRIKGEPEVVASEEECEWPEGAEMEVEEKERVEKEGDSAITDFHGSEDEAWAERMDFLGRRTTRSHDSLGFSLHSSISDLEDRRGAPELSFLGGFLREFESLPSLSDISENSTTVESETRPSVAPPLPERISVDPGRFVQSVDRFSGSSSSGRTLSDSSSSVFGLIGEEEEEPEELSQTSFLGSLIEEPETVRKEVIIQDDVDMMAQIYVESESDDDGKDVVDPKLAQQIQLSKMMSDFLESLINRAVQLSEIGARAKLFDKGKMLVEIERLVHLFIVERSTNNILNNKMGEHCKRNRKPDKYATLPPAVETIEHRRYVGALNVVDNLMERLTIIKNNGSFVISRAQLELHSCYTLSKFVTENLENCMRKGLLRQDSDKLRRLLDAELRRMENLRNEISERRYELNLNLRSLAVITEKMRLVERITDDLTTSEVQNATDNIIHLEKRLEDRTKEVLAMQANYKKFLIEKTCIREKRTMIAQSLEIAKEALKEKGDKLYEVRHYLSDIQADRLKIKTTHARLHAKGGLLFHPALMYEYDKCLEEVQERRATVAKLRKTYTDLSSRYSMLERQKTTATVASV
ncbi:uncharacterized protein LOC108160988 isoform X2 [Drosophila miranda]|uniref:uncharacterized protein LOC108160988 isoform X2 n=1 Tax=Drosophila miranda TaxID=7229 RepID=UPI0007E7038D|nr:uncharacterized protein LOC108160988 isoform X2 [Drosophila miranda]